ncbi:MAG TPA: hypothetical protein VFM18_14855 [Methanosarcina sp.]|nr:hypothetical protein [Methanosarcina sp.]
MSENKDYKKLKANALDPLDRIDRIENVILTGMPDVNYCIEGAEGWIELKSPTEPKRQSTKLFGSNHKLSQEQKNWFLRQRNSGGRGFVLICSDKRWLLIDGCHADSINEMTVEELVGVAIWIAPAPVKGKETWKLLRQHLMK